MYVCMLISQSFLHCIQIRISNLRVKPGSFEYELYQWVSSGKELTDDQLSKLYRVSEEKDRTFESTHEAVIVAAHSAEDMGWLVNQHQYPYIVYTKSQEAAQLNPHFRYLSVNLGTEAFAYLTYIVEEYYKLPEVVAFVHGHETSWHQGVNVLQILQSLGNLSQITYRSLSDRGPWHCFELQGQARCQKEERQSKEASCLEEESALVIHDIRSLERYFSFYLSVSRKEMPTYMIIKCCAQYLIHRRVIQARPLEFYKNTLQNMYNRALKEDLYSEVPRQIGLDFEFMSFKFFTGLDDECEMKRLSGMA
jgi:hypothetical protein